MGFKSMKKMETTEPSVDEVGKGMKSGGKTKKMAMGGSMPVGALPAMTSPAMGRRPAAPARPAMKRPMGRPDPRAALAEAAMVDAAMSKAPMMRKNGGSMKKVEKEIRNEKEELHRVDERLNRHEAKAASKAHKGLATGGVANAQGGYKKGGVAKYATGGLIQKYATGGVVNGAAGYKDGGHCAMKSGGEAGFKANKKNCSW